MKHTIPGKQARAPRGRSWRARAGPAPAAALALVTALGLSSRAAPAPQEGAAPLDAARAVLERLLETQRLISKERSDWELARESVQRRIELRRREIEALRGRVEETRGRLGELEAEAAVLESERARLAAIAGAWHDPLPALEERTRALLAALPEPLRATVEPLRRRMPAADAPDSELGESSTTRRFQNIVGILDQVNKFQREVHVTSELLQLEDGRRAEVGALYVGIAQGYYVSADGLAAGVGSGTGAGWRWRSSKEDAPAIAAALATRRGERPPSFVALPIDIEGPAR